MSRVHEVTIGKDLAERIESGDRPFLFQQNDEEFQTGDLIKFKVYSVYMDKRPDDAPLQGKIMKIRYIIPNAFEKDQVLLYLAPTNDDLFKKIQNILVEVGQSDHRFSLGDKIRYTPSEVAEILEEKWDEY